jgi:DNA-binding CsgD family transcriptional regulator
MPNRDDPPRPRRPWPPAPADLSPAEAAVLPWLGEELTYEEIAQRFGINSETIRVHARRIYEKLGARTRHGAMVRWLRPDLNGHGAGESADSTDSRR